MLESQNTETGPLLFSWRLTGEGRAATEVDGIQQIQRDDESREQFLERVAASVKGSRVFVWVSEQDAKL